ncbi:MAG: putative toxin-antitoxin system toxin component, PIN family [Muribaculaceae bacterium]|nr:putative toxin-antitoxin system toxin component, PIN family [Muribaculaceae bacterium]
MSEKGKVYAVIDTNVLVSSLFSTTDISNPARVIGAVLNGAIIPLYNNEIIEEYRDILSRDKFKFSTALIDSLLSAFTEFGINTARKDAGDEIFPDEDDIVFYEVVLSVEDAYLVTGNTKHFPIRTFIVTPAQMVDILREKALL